MSTKEKNYENWNSPFLIYQVTPETRNATNFTADLRRMDAMNGRRRGIVVSGVRHMKEVNPRRARLVLGWVTAFGLVYHLGM